MHRKPGKIRTDPDKFSPFAYDNPLRRQPTGDGEDLTPEQLQQPADASGDGYGSRPGSKRVQIPLRCGDAAGEHLGLPSCMFRHPSDTPSLHTIMIFPLSNPPPFYPCHQYITSDLLAPLWIGVSACGLAQLRTLNPQWPSICGPTQPIMPPQPIVVAGSSLRQERCVQNCHRFGVSLYHGYRGTSYIELI